MIVTKQAVAERIAAHLQHRVTLPQFVDWAENAMMDGEFDEKDAATIAAVVARLGVADVRAFGLTWADCEELLAKLGFAARVEIVAV
jgi:cobyrinic acid a,c-diamide synthase